MSEIQFIQIPFGSAEYALALVLRHKILRAPLGLHYTIDSLNNENEQLHFVAIHRSTVIANCIVQIKNKQLLKLRQMCVESHFQNQNIGMRMMQMVEKFAVENHYKTIELHARQTAIPFYEKMKFTIKGKAFEEVGLTHFYMIKELD